MLARHVGPHHRRKTARRRVATASRVCVMSAMDHMESTRFMQVPPGGGELAPKGGAVLAVADTDAVDDSGESSPPSEYDLIQAFAPLAGAGGLQDHGDEPSTGAIPTPGSPIPWPTALPWLTPLGGKPPGSGPRGPQPPDSSPPRVPNGGPSEKHAVPEPASWILAIGGLVLVGAVLRRRRQRSTAFTIAERASRPEGLQRGARLAGRVGRFCGAPIARFTSAAFDEAGV
jgi:hypothetical protein